MFCKHVGGTAGRYTDASLITHGITMKQYKLFPLKIYSIKL